MSPIQRKKCEAAGLAEDRRLACSMLPQHGVICTDGRKTASTTERVQDQATHSATNKQMDSLWV